MKFRNITVLFFTAFAVLAGQNAWAHKIKLDVLIKGGTIVTMDAQRRVVADALIGIQNGKISFVTDDPSFEKKFVARKTIHAENKIIIPGLINAHTHIPMTLFRGIGDDLELMTWLTKYIWPAEATFVNEDFVRVGTLLGCLEMIEGGTTTFVDMYFFEDAIASATQQCGLRAILGETLIDFKVPDNNLEDLDQRWQNGISIARTFIEAWKNHPTITPAIAPHAPYTVSPAHLHDVELLAEQTHAPIVIHLAETKNETKKIEGAYSVEIQSPVEYLSHLGLLSDQLIAAHVVSTNEQDRLLLRDSGVGVVHCPQSNLKLASGVACTPEMVDCNIPIALGTDGAASNNDLNLWEEINLTAILHKGVSQDPTTISAQKAFEMATIEGARAIHMEDKIGSIEPGKLADVVIVNPDSISQAPQYVKPTTVYSQLVYTTKASDVDTVLVHGKVLMENKKIGHLPVEKIKQEARAMRKKIDTFLDNLDKK